MTTTDRPIEPPRWFAASSDGQVVSMTHEETLGHMGISPSVSAAYDLLTDDGMDAERVAKLVTGAERSGRDPEAFARHVLKLRRGLRDTPPG